MVSIWEKCVWNAIIWFIWVRCDDVKRRLWLSWWSGHCKSTEFQSMSPNHWAAEIWRLVHAYQICEPQNTLKIVCNSVGFRMHVYIHNNLIQGQQNLCQLPVAEHFDYKVNLSTLCTKMNKQDDFKAYSGFLRVRQCLITHTAIAYLGTSFGLMIR